MANDKGKKSRKKTQRDEERKVPETVHEERDSSKDKTLDQLSERYGADESPERMREQHGGQ